MPMTDQKPLEHQVVGPPRQSRSPRHSTRRAIHGYLYISPWIIGLVVFTLFPILWSLKLSFEEFSLLSPSTFVGTENYERILTNDREFRTALRVTTVYSVASIPLKAIAALLLALLLNNSLRAVGLFRTVYFLPGVLAGSAVALMWMQIFRTDRGLANRVLSWIGIEGPAWLFDPAYILYVFITISVWNVGAMMVFYLAALQSVPKQLYEAAAIDGAGRIRKFFSVTVPMITPIILFNLVMNIIASFQVFTEGYVIFQALGTGVDLGGPENAALFYVVYLYQQAFRFLSMGYASALAWILFVIILLLSLVVIKSSPIWVYYQSGDQK